MTYTEADLTAAVAKAVQEATAPLTARIAELETSEQTTAVNKAVVEAVSTKDAEIAELQSKLDATTVEVAAAKQEAETAKQALVDFQEKQAIEARKEERVEKIKAAKCLSDEYIEKNAERFASMTDEEFTARLEEWTQIVAAKSAAPEEPIPTTTSLTASRDENTNGFKSMLVELPGLRASLVDPRTL